MKQKENEADTGIISGITPTHKADYTETIFESIKRINEYGQEFWYARELQTALEYTQWRRFREVIERAKDACQRSGNSVFDHLPMPAKWYK